MYELLETIDDPAALRALPRKALPQLARELRAFLLDSVAKIGEKWSELVRLPDMETKEYSYVACKFAGRCPYVRDICRQVKPPMVEMPDGREALCFKLVDYQDVGAERVTQEKVAVPA